MSRHDPSDVLNNLLILQLESLVLEPLDGIAKLGRSGTARIDAAPAVVIVLLEAREGAGAASPAPVPAKAIQRQTIWTKPDSRWAM